MITNRRIDLLMATSNKTNIRLLAVIAGVSNLYHKVGMENNRLKAWIDYLRYFDDGVVGKVIPVVADYFRAVVNADIQVKLW